MPKPTSNPPRRPLPEGREEPIIFDKTCKIEDRLVHNNLMKLEMISEETTGEDHHLVHLQESNRTLNEHGGADHHHQNQHHPQLL
jgi:hypothetical protein